MPLAYNLGGEDVGREVLRQPVAGEDRLELRYAGASCGVAREAC